MTELLLQFDKNMLRGIRNIFTFLNNAASLSLNVTPKTINRKTGFIQNFNSIELYAENDISLSILSK